MRNLQLNVHCGFYFKEEDTCVRFFQVWDLLKDNLLLASKAQKYHPDAHLLYLSHRHNLPKQRNCCRKNIACWFSWIGHIAKKEKKYEAILLCIPLPRMRLIPACCQCMIIASSCLNSSTLLQGKEMRREIGSHNLQCQT